LPYLINYYFEIQCRSVKKGKKRGNTRAPEAHNIQYYQLHPLGELSASTAVLHCTLFGAIFEGGPRVVFSKFSYEMPSPLPALDSVLLVALTTFLLELAFKVTVYL